MLPKRLLAFTLFATLAAMNAGALRAQWVPTNGPGNGPGVYALLVNNGTVFAGIGGSLNTDLFFSNDSGSTWQAAKSVYSDYSTTSLFSDKGYLFSNVAGGLFRSSDNGTTWQITEAGILGRRDCIAAGADTLYTATTDDNSFVLPPINRIYKSTDEGNSWSQLFADTSNRYIFSMCVLGDNIFASRAGSILRSQDGGVHWTSDSSIPASSINTLATMGNSVLGSVAGKGIYRSTDSGNSWKPSSKGLSVTKINGFVQIGADIYALGEGIYRSSDSGATWSIVDSEFKPNVFSLCQVGSVFIAGTDTSGLLVSRDNGVSWTRSITGMATGQIRGMTSTSSGLLASTTHGTYYTTDDGAHWASPDSLTSFGILTSSDSYPFISDGNIARSPDNSSHVLVDTNFPYNIDRPTDGPGATSIIQIGDTILAAAGYGVYRTTDMGKSWVDANEGLPFEWMGPFARIGSDMVVGVNSDPFFSDPGSGLYRSTNNGFSWFPSNRGIDTSNIICIANGMNHIFAGTLVVLDNGNGADLTNIYESNNNGYSWSPLHVGINDSVELGSEVFSIGGGRIFVNSNQGLLFSSDDGSSWANVDSGLSKSSVTSIVVRGQYLFVGTNTTGVYRRPLSDFEISSVAQEPAPIPLAIHTYPNPFSQSTTIAFTTEASGYADVSIVNLLGAEVAHLFSGELAAGNHSFTWDANWMSAPRGMYECLVRMNGRVETVPMVFTR